MPIRITTWLPRRIPRSWFKNNKVFDGTGVLTQPFAANPHRLTDEQWSALVAEAERDVPTSDASNLPPDDDWLLKPGEEIRRVDLHNRYGGSRQGGISPSQQTDNILIFTDATAGPQHGYEDRWESDGTFRYTGEGQIGDQTFTKGNKAIRDHLKNGKRLRLFIGSRGVVRYTGEWVLNPGKPYSWGSAPSTNNGPLRTVIYFHLLRVGDAVMAPNVPIGSEYRPENESVIPLPATPSAPDWLLVGRNLATHRGLQNALADLVRAHGMTPLSPTLTDPAFDLAWKREEILTVAEVKSLRLENETEQLRSGLGQLLDYVDQLSARAPNVRGVLWVERAPSESRWLGICERAGIVLAWPGQDMRIWM
ncbi:YDG/SRA domain-containing protein [Streptomyces sp. NBC_00510]